MQTVGNPLFLLVEWSGRVECHPFGERQRPLSLVGKYAIECKEFARFLIVSYYNDTGGLFVCDGYDSINKQSPCAYGLQAAEAFTDDLGSIGDRNEGALVGFPYKLPKYNCLPSGEHSGQHMLFFVSECTMSSINGSSPV
jgi:hypothetical protein